MRQPNCIINNAPFMRQPIALATNHRSYSNAPPFLALLGVCWLLCARAPTTARATRNRPSAKHCNQPATPPSKQCCISMAGAAGGRRPSDLVPAPPRARTASRANGWSWLLLGDHAARGARAEQRRRAAGRSDTVRSSLLLRPPLAAAARTAGSEEERAGRQQWGGAARRGGLLGGGGKNAHHLCDGEDNNRTTTPHGDIYNNNSALRLAR